MDQPFLKAALRFAAAACFGLAACDAGTQPYLHHSLSFTKTGSDCTRNEGRFAMNANINGERYEFQQCLDADFDIKKATVARKGDTVVLSFTRNNAAQSLFQLTLDIDTYPRYHFLTIGANTFAIIPAAN